MDDLDKAKLQGKAYIFVDYDKMSSFPNTTDASIHRPMCKQPLNWFVHSSGNWCRWR